MTSGYVDYVIGNTAMNDELYANPFRRWTVDDILSYATSKPLLYRPGTNWNYAHTNYVLLGLALEKATGQEMSKLLSNKVLQPLGLTNTVNSLTPEIPSPVLHAFSSERREFLKIPAGTPFYEESTFWDPSWTITHGAIQTTNIFDMEATAVGIGSGKLLTADSYNKMVSTNLRGKTHKQDGCTTCDEMNNVYTYGLGIVITGNWLVQNPLMSGYAALEAYLPSQKIAIAIAATYAPEAFDDKGNYRNEADTVFRKVAAELAPTVGADAASIGRSVSSAAGALGGSEENGAVAALQKELEKALAPEIFHKDVALRQEPDGLVISLREVEFFASGSAELRLNAIPTLRRVTAVLLERPYEIRIEGHTDNVRIHTAQFASNWELSAARAIEVVRLMISDMGFAPQRLSVGGYGEFHPVAPNTTEEERALNRRVDVVILRRSILAAAHVVDVAKEARESRSSPEPRGVPEPPRTDGKPSPAHGMSKVSGLGG